MGLYNYTYIDFTKKLSKLGFVFEKQAKWSHEIWYNSERNIVFTVPHHTGKSVSIWVIKSFLKIMRMNWSEFHNI